MTKKTLEGSFAIAEVIKNCDPDVVACYPITPSSHIAEKLAEFYANGELKDYITTEAEFSSISAIIGGALGGGRSISATSSQGLALMHEGIYAAAGLRAPCVLVVGNRALSAPLNIWCDHQDSVAERDSGWIQFYCETIQEAVDTVPQAFKVAEKNMLPTMVCIDGFYLTHAVVNVNIPEKEKIKKFLPPYKPVMKLDTSNPLTLGVYAFPKHYQGFRKDIHKDLINLKKDIKKVDKEFEKIFGRSYGGLIEKYKVDDADYVLVAMGSIVGNIKEVVDELRRNGDKVGVLRVRCYRPFPNEEIKETLKEKEGVGIFEKSYSLGAAPPLYLDIMESLFEVEKKIKISSFVGGLGGKDITTSKIKEIFDKIKEDKCVKIWV